MVSLVSSFSDKHTLPVINIIYFLVVVVQLKIEVSAEQKPILPPSQDEPQQSAAQEAQSEVRQRLSIIPVTFVLLRMWGTLQLFYSLIRVTNGCVPSQGDAVVLRILGVVQVKYKCMK